MKLYQCTIILIMPFLVTACATVNPQKDFDAVSSSSKSKVGHTVTWQQTPMGLSATLVNGKTDGKGGNPQYSGSRL